MCPGPAFARFSNIAISPPIRSMRWSCFAASASSSSNRYPIASNRWMMVSKFNRARRTVSRATAIASP
jgi:hypothetical protein